MRKQFLTLVLIFAAFQFAIAQTPTLGTYSLTAVATSGSNATVVPSASPTNTAGITAYTSTNFKGLLHVNPATGVVTITNAHPAGTYSVTVKGFNGTLSTTVSFILQVGNAICSNPGAPVNVTTGANSYAVAVNDFNNDGNQDFIVANYNSAGTVAIRFGDGAGGFSGTTSIAVGNNPRAIVTSDFNGDGNADLATLNQFSATVSVRLGDGVGAFSNAPDFIVATNPNCMAVGDFNSDGITDLAIAIFSSSVVSIRLGDGTGNFSGATNIAVGTNPRAITVSDFNSDGKSDFATVSGASGVVTVRLNDGSGGFTNAPNVTFPNSGYSVATADFNVDGNMDMVIVTNNSISYGGGSMNLALVRLGDGAGNFSGTTNITVGALPQHVAVADFNGDGKPDFATANIGNTISVRLSNGTGGFSGGPDVTVVNYPKTLAIGDFNEDGKPDIVAIKDGNIGAVTIAGSSNEIGVSGNNNGITDGSTLPDATNYTDFGNAGSVTRTYCIKSTGVANLTINSISISGADAPLFTTAGITLPATIASGDSAIFTVRFAPVSAGLKTATVNIGNDDCDEAVYDFAVQGTGVVPTLGNYSATTVNMANGNIKTTPAAAPANATGIMATATTNFKGTLHADPVTGLVTITNAHPAGNYMVTVKVFNGLLTTTNTFLLTVNNSSCGQGLFGGNTAIAVGSGPAALAIGDFNGDSKQDFITADVNVGSVSVRLGDGAGAFTSAATIAVGGNPKSVVVSDFNGDGKQDFAVTFLNYNTIAIYFGNGAGGFLNGGVAFGGGTPFMVLTADLNNDGKADLATVNSTSNNISIRLGDGSGAFVTASDVPVGGSPQAAAIGDFNNDGKPDLAVANTALAGSVAIKLGDGTGGFSGTTNVIVNGSPFAIAADDFNGDGNTDLAILNASGNRVLIRLGNGTGNFTGTQNLAVAGGSASVVTGDYNGDGKPDFIVSSPDNNIFSVHLCDSTGNFIAIANVFAGSSPRALAVGDFNGDGKQDIAAASSTGTTVAIRLGTGNEINLQGNTTNIAAGSSTPALANHTDFGDVSSSVIRSFTIQNTGTGSLIIRKITVSGADTSIFTIASTTVPTTIDAGSAFNFNVGFVPVSTGLKTATINVTSNDCDESMYNFAIQGTGIAIAPTLGNYPATTIPVAGSSATVIPDALPGNAVAITASTSAGFKGLLQIDSATGKVIVTNAYPAGTYVVTVKAQGIISTSRTFVLTVNNTACSQGRLSRAPNLGVTTNPQSVAIGDFNGDGKQDFITTGQYFSSVSIRLGNGAGEFPGISSVGMGISTNSLTVADFNSDGKQDFAAASYGNNLVLIKFGNGAGGFISGPAIPVGTNPRSVAVADFNGDGKVDFATPNMGSNSVSIRLGNGIGGFNGGSEVVVGTSPVSIAVSDFNNDGNLDFVATNYGDSIISVRLGNGAGGFTQAANVLAGAYPHTVITADFNKDGKQDIAYSRYNSSQVAVRLGDGTGGFDVTINVAVGMDPMALAMGDFNGDGNADLAVVNSLTSNVSIRLGDGAGNFSGTKDYAVGSVPESIAIGDFNSDGKQDFLSPSFYSSSMYVYWGSDKEIEVKGNSTSIANSDSIPGMADNTDFGNTPMGSNTSYTFKIFNVSSDTLIINAINIRGADSAMFSVGGITFPARLKLGDSATFIVAFTPTSSGSKTTQIRISSNDCDESDFGFTVKGFATIVPGPNLNVWLGNSADWNLASNWSLGFVPLESTKVAVNASVSFMPEITSPGSICYSLTLNNGATVTVTGTGRLTITGP